MLLSVLLTLLLDFCVRKYFIIAEDLIHSVSFELQLQSVNHAEFDFKIGHHLYISQKRRIISTIKLNKLLQTIAFQEIDLMLLFVEIYHPCRKSSLLILEIKRMFVSSMSQNSWLIRKRKSVTHLINQSLIYQHQHFAIFLN